MKTILFSLGSALIAGILYFQFQSTPLTTALINQYGDQLQHPTLTIQYIGEMKTSDSDVLKQIPAEHIHTMEAANQGTRYVITMKTQDFSKKGVKEIIQLQKTYSNHLHIRQEHWTVTIQGEVKKSKKVSAPSNSKQVDTYQDQAVKLTTYAAPTLPKYKHYDFNLQIAEHRLAHTGHTRVTIGYPVVQSDI